MSTNKSAHTPGPWAVAMRVNAHRIVACVNACEGIADPAELRAQRDELLAALRGLLDDPYLRDPINADRMAPARAAIARAERGQ